MTQISQQHQTAQENSRKIEALLHASETALTAKQLRQHLDISTDDLQMALI